MKTIYLLLFGFFLAAIQPEDAAAQFLYKRADKYFLGSKPIPKSEVKSLLLSNELSAQYLFKSQEAKRKATSRSITGATLGLLGTYMVLGSINAVNENDELGTIAFTAGAASMGVLLGASIAITGGGLLISGLSNSHAVSRHRKRSMRSYNKQAVKDFSTRQLMSLDLGITNAGVGLVLTF